MHSILGKNFGPLYNFREFSQVDYDAVTQIMESTSEKTHSKS